MSTVFGYKVSQTVYANAQNSLEQAFGVCFGTLSVDFVGMVNFCFKLT